jgi:anaerobic glycerol-3-phosphate dehydrogenase
VLCSKGWAWSAVRDNRRIGTSTLHASQGLLDLLCIVSQCLQAALQAPAHPFSLLCLKPPTNLRHPCQQLLLACTSQLLTSPAHGTHYILPKLKLACTTTAAITTRVQQPC